MKRAAIYAIAAATLLGFALQAVVDDAFDRITKNGELLELAYADLEGALVRLRARVAGAEGDGG